ncbi:MAG: Si-specific NAD(P)(+) transhydrogenase [Lentisphaeraceae bacterium]|nr:Si-specific NAD(P)(+) transhydrogenase [Lentisphaeraceae bacterium]
MSFDYDFIVIGSGPGGHNAAINASKNGQSVAIIEKEREIGGACVHQGTIPSKTLRETASNLSRFTKSANSFEFSLNENVQVESLMNRKVQVRKAHVKYMENQLDDVDSFRGKGTFIDDHTIEIKDLKGNTKQISGKYIIIATGSRPRDPENIPTDHEHILDSDSILSMIYLPSSITVLGGGVISCEYATIFSVLGVKVTIIDTADRPLRFLDPQITDKFIESFENENGTYLGERKIESVEWDGVSEVITKLEGGEVIKSQKMLVALGRLANVEILNPTKVGVTLTPRNQIIVNENYQTEVPHIYAVGDVIGFPALASTSMEQGRRAIAHALNLDMGTPFENVPMGIYTIPEISCIGLAESEAREKHGNGIIIGYANFDEVARGQISGISDGLLKIICAEDGQTILGVHIIGEGSTELIHVAQMAILGGLPLNTFIENVMNFPTLAEAYRVAAMDVAVNFAKKNKK